MQYLRRYKLWVTVLTSSDAVKREAHQSAIACFRANWLHQQRKFRTQHDARYCKNLGIWLADLVTLNH